MNNTAGYGHYRHAPSPLSTINFDDIQPAHIQLAFRDIHYSLKTLNAGLAESAITNLRRAADDYAMACHLEAKFKEQT